MDVANDIDARRFAVGVMALDALRQLSPESMKQRSLQPQLLIQQRLGLIGPRNPLEIFTGERPPISIASIDLEHGPVPIDDLLGAYFPERQEIKIFENEIQITAHSLKIPPDDLQYAVRLHEYAHAVVHLGLGVGYQGQLADEPSIVITEPGDWKEFIDGRSRLFARLSSEAHELLTQTMVWCLLGGDEQKRNAMLSLMEKQSDLYRLSDQIREHVTLEGIRVVLNLIWRVEVCSDKSDDVRYLRCLLELKGFPECVLSHIAGT